jgi:hypothetical protein
VGDAEERRSRRRGGTRALTFQPAVCAQFADAATEVRPAMAPSRCPRTKAVCGKCRRCRLRSACVALCCWPSPACHARASAESPAPYGGRVLPRPLFTPPDLPQTGPAEPAVTLPDLRLASAPHGLLTATPLKSAMAGRPALWPEPARRSARTLCRLRPLFQRARLFSAGGCVCLALSWRWPRVPCSCARPCHRHW